MSQSQSKLRTAAIAARSQLSDEQRRLASQKIADAVLASSYFRNAKRIGCYVAIDSEVSCWTVVKRAWAEKKRIFTPVVKKNRVLEFRELSPNCSLTVNSMGLSEPTDGELVTSKSLDIVITPLVAFDDHRNRIGMGGGYFDREFSYLAEQSGDPKPMLIGVAFDCQHVEEIAPNPWDIRLFRVFTESRTV